MNNTPKPSRETIQVFIGIIILFLIFILFYAFMRNPDIIFFFTKFTAEKKYAPILRTIPVYPGAQNTHIFYNGNSFIDGDPSGVIEFNIHDNCHEVVGFYDKALQTKGWHIAYSFGDTQRTFLKRITGQQFKVGFSCLENVKANLLLDDNRLIH